MGSKNMAWFDKNKIFKIIFIVWIILWVFFLIREDKDGQYKSLKYLYTHDNTDRTRYVIGGKLYDLLVFCRYHMHAGSTFELTGFKKFSIYEVRARYFMWPLKSVAENGDYLISYGGKAPQVPGFTGYKKFENTGYLLKRKDITR